MLATTAAKVDMFKETAPKRVPGLATAVTNLDIWPANVPRRVMTKGNATTVAKLDTSPRPARSQGTDSGLSLKLLAPPSRSSVRAMQ